MARPEFLSVPPEEAIRFFREKGYHVAFDWRDTSALHHTRSFTVSKVMQLDILEDIRAAMDAAKADGTTFETFRDELEPLLRSKGWWGRQAMRDPLTGEVHDVQLGSVRRLRTIFDTNIRMAIARGRWERIQRQAESRPYLRYMAVLDARTRPDHRAWHGTVLPHDHPFWETHYPPCGWHCRCTVMQLSQFDLEDFGYEVTEPPAGWNDTRPWVDRRNGRTVQVPVGIDPGFQHNVGTIDLVQDARSRLDEKLRDAPATVRQTVAEDPDLQG